MHFCLTDWDTHYSLSLTLSWMSPADERRLEMRFDSIEMLQLRGIDARVPRKEDRRLSFFGYVHPEDLDLMDGFLPEDLAGEGFHFILSFEGGLVVKLQCLSAKLSEATGSETASSME